MPYVNNMNLNAAPVDDPIDNVPSQLEEAEHLAKEAQQLLAQCEGPLK